MRAIVRINPVLPLVRIARPAGVLASALFLLAGCATAPRATVASPCRGNAIDLNVAAKRCLAEGTRPLPPSDVLPLSIEPRPVRVAGGATARFAVVLTNRSRQPVPLTLEPHWSPALISVEDAAGHRIDETPESGGLLLGSRGSSGYVHVVLSPGGRAVEHLTYGAVVRHMKVENGVARTASRTPIPPGTYTLRVMTPLSDPVPGQPHMSRRRMVTAKLVVSPESK